MEQLDKEASSALKRLRCIRQIADADEETLGIVSSILDRVLLRRSRSGRNAGRADAMRRKAVRHEAHEAPRSPMLALVIVAGCGKSGDTIGEWLGATDKPQKAPVFYEELCDPSSGTTCSAETLRDTSERSYA